MRAKRKAEAEETRKKSEVKLLRKNCPNVLSRFVFGWMLSLFFTGYRRDLEEDDLSPAKQCYDSKTVGDRLERKWMEEIEKARSESRKPVFRKALIAAFFWSYLPGGIMLFLYTSIYTLSPLLFKQLLKYWVEGSAMSQKTAILFGVYLILFNWLKAFLNYHGVLYCEQFGMKLRVATSSVIFRKILRMDKSSLVDITAGKIVNILSNDLQRYVWTLQILHYLWIVPIQFIAVGYLGYLEAGISAIISLVTLMVIALPLQIGIGQLIGKTRNILAQKTDIRIKIMSEVISGIQVIKMFAWEIPFEKLISDKRNDELSAVKKATMQRTLLLGFITFTERTAVFFTILTFILLGNNISASVIYPLQEFISAIQLNITLIYPLIFAYMAELVVTLNRIENILLVKECSNVGKEQWKPRFPQTLFKRVGKDEGIHMDYVKPLSYKCKSFFNTGENGSVSIAGPLKENKSDMAIELQDVSASWLSDAKMLTLENMSLSLPKGKLCAVIGSVGSGKSSFLQLLLKEISVIKGNISVQGKLSYASQEAWLFPDTVRENILFGLPFDAQKYKKVCKVCELVKDFKQFPFDDQTFVGDQGSSLSGGQRARINLARSVYREADIYLLDDPLSAVDATVGRQLFERCIKDHLHDKTRILVTHQLHFVKSADYIIVMDEGIVKDMGSFDELITSSKEFIMILSTLQDDKRKELNRLVSNVSGKENKGKIMLRKSSTFIENDVEEHEAQILDSEKRQSGILKFKVIIAYIKASGSYSLILMTISMILLSITLAGGADYWLSFWINQVTSFNRNSEDIEMDIGLHVKVGVCTTAEYLIIFSTIIIVCIFVTTIRIIPYVKLAVSSSKYLHHRMLFTLLKSYMQFFHKTSSGRILNRFTKDMGAVDEVIPRCLLDLLNIFSIVISILLLNAFAFYWTIVPSLVMIIIFYFAIIIYVRTAQDIKRIEGTTISPIFSLVSSTLNGITTIRSANAQNRLMGELDQKQNLHTAALNTYLAGKVTFGFYLDTFCQIYLASIIYLLLYFDLGIIPVGSVGLAMTQSFRLTDLLQFGIRMLGEFFAEMTSVERILEYSKIESEPNLYIGEMPTPALWPLQGHIIFNDVSLRYSQDEEPVLRNVNIVAEGGAKIGIIGRTGAGKSSLISALFRFAHLEGTITVDGVDVAKISRQDLRSKISIIPQEPILFSATIRFNVDPFDVHTDDEIWRALEQVDMKTSIHSLDFQITEGGNNFSCGQRQLICLARAILRANKILIMDEATANVDPQTDTFIQKTIRSQFASCTVLTIAHRLNTIMDSDKLLVMDSGKVAEFDHPYTLLKDPNSHLSVLVKETGEKMSEQLLEVARTAFEKTVHKTHT